MTRNTIIGVDADTILTTATKLDELQPGTDTDVLNATAEAHGLLRKLSGISTDFLRGDGVWAAPTTGGDVTLDDLFPTVEVTGTTADAQVNHAYLCNNNARVVITLPASAAVGQKIELIGKGPGGWRLAQRDSQYVRLDTAYTTMGTGGSIDSTARYDCIILRCTVTNTTWTAISIIGNLEVT